MKKISKLFNIMAVVSFIALGGLFVACDPAPVANAGGTAGGGATGGSGSTSGDPKFTATVEITMTGTPTNATDTNAYKLQVYTKDIDTTKTVKLTKFEVACGSEKGDSPKKELNLEKGEKEGDACQEIISGADWFPSTMTVPKTGDKVKITLEGTVDPSIKKLTFAIVDNTEAAGWWKTLSNETEMELKVEAADSGKTPIIKGMNKATVDEKGNTITFEDGYCHSLYVFAENGVKADMIANATKCKVNYTNNNDDPKKVCITGIKDVDDFWAVGNATDPAYFDFAVGSGTLEYDASKLVGCGGLKIQSNKDPAGGYTITIDSIVFE